MVEIGLIVLAVLVGLLLIFLVYRAMRTYDAGAHATFITTKNGSFYGALRAPMTIWDPSIKVLREKHAPNLSVMTMDATGGFYEKSLVNRRNGEITLRVQTCAPRPFFSTTTDKRQLLIKTKVAFQLDVERIQIPTQMESFGTSLVARIENLFDNAISEFEDQDVFKNQREIEHRVLRELREMEGTNEENPTGMPLGIIIYEAMFSFERPQKAINRDLANGPMAYDNEHLDDLVDMLEKADPKTVEVLMRMLELQTRQNIVQLLCKSGGLVAFTAQELGLSERTVERARWGANIMKDMEPPPVAATVTAAPNGGAEAPVAKPVDPATAYYNLGAPKGQKAAEPPKDS